MRCRSAAPLAAGLARPVRGAALAASVIALTAAGTPFPAAADEPISCAALLGRTIPTDKIGGPALKTRGAFVTAASPATIGGGSGATGFCQVAAEILAVDIKAPPIHIIINLPETWNGKGLMNGGGGYDGSVPDTTDKLNQFPARPPDVPVPLAQGYATFSSDSGHTGYPGALGTAKDGFFGTNDEALHNFAGDALKKTKDVAVELINLHYGKAPQRLYFIGGSSGGREALAVAQRWGGEWDGVIAQYPAFNAASLDLQFGRITRAFAAPGAYPSQAQRRLLLDAALAACDELDGAKDGIVSNVAKCNEVFDPETAMVNGKRLRCPDGIDFDDRCLPESQIRALKTLATEIAFPYPLQSGETHYPGFNVWGADLGTPNPNALEPAITGLALGTEPPGHAMPDAAPFAAVFWDQWVRYFVTRSAEFDSLQLDPQHPGKWTARISELTGLQDVNKTDLSALQRHGGKLLLAHGTADVLVSTRATEEYYRRLSATMKGKVEDFVRFYEIPGYGHAFSTIFNAGWDSLGALDKWVETGKPPEDLVVADTVNTRTRPLCEYPKWPKYQGSGDINAAGSFRCVEH